LRTGDSATRADLKADDDDMTTEEQVARGKSKPVGSTDAVSRGQVGPPDGIQRMLDLPLNDPAMLSYNEHLLQDIASLLAAAALGGVLASFAGAPPSFGYLVGGAVVGPSGLGIVT